MSVAVKWHSVAVLAVLEVVTSITCGEGGRARRRSVEGGAGQRRDRGARARDVLSAGKRYTLLARIAARGDLGPRRSGLPRGVIFPAADEKRAPRKTRATARARGRKPSTAGDRDAGIASVPAVPVPRGHDGFVPSGFPAPACLEWEARPPARGETRGSHVASRDGVPRRRTLVGRPDDHESALANGTGLHGDGGGRAGIGGLEFLDVGVVRHGWMLRLLGRVPCAAGTGLYRECLRL